MHLAVCLLALCLHFGLRAEAAVPLYSPDKAKLVVCVFDYAPSESYTKR